jgi:hypothetical protein
MYPIQSRRGDISDGMAKSKPINVALSPISANMTLLSTPSTSTLTKPNPN